MVNSSWTQSHIEKLCNFLTRSKRVYPPCDTYRLQALSLEKPAEPAKFIYVAQFQPKKALGLQLEAFAVAIGKLDAHLPRPKLQFVGSCRNKADEESLQHLKDKAVELKVDGDVEFHKNVLYRSVPRISCSASFNVNV
ncbi:hypothetical protein ACFX1Q_008297 [Malus domestica]